MAITRDRLGRFAAGRGTAERLTLASKLKKSRSEHQAASANWKKALSGSSQTDVDKARLKEAQTLSLTLSYLAEAKKLRGKKLSPRQSHLNFNAQSTAARLRGRG